MIDEDERRTLKAVAALPVDGEAGTRFLNVEGAGSLRDMVIKAKIA